MKLTPVYGLVLGALMVACTTPQKEQASEAVINTMVPMVEANEVEYVADSTVMIGYLAFDANDSSQRPGIIVVHEWWGHNDHSREKAEMLAELGYVALAVDMYGDGKQAAHPEEAGQFAGMVMGNFEQAKARFESAIQTLKNHPNVDDSQIGAIGYCFGGSVVLSMANAGYDLDAVAAFHAGLQLPVMPDSGSVKGKILVANGGADPMITDQHVQDFKSVMDAAGADYTYISYEGVKHAYTNKEADALSAKFEMNGALSYDAQADSASWEEMKKLFNSAFK